MAAPSVPDCSQVSILCPEPVDHHPKICSSKVKTRKLQKRLQHTLPLNYILKQAAEPKGGALSVSSMSRTLHINDTAAIECSLRHNCDLVNFISEKLFHKLYVSKLYFYIAYSTIRSICKSAMLFVNI